MPSFPKPRFAFDFDPVREIEVIRHYRDTRDGRQIPPRDAGHLLLATWNIANLGLQQRRERDYRILAEIISWFDLIAVQEVHDNLAGLRGIQEHLPEDYQAVFSDKGGNEERGGFFYDASKIGQLELVGEIAIPPKEVKWIKLTGVDREFSGFDRNPFLVSFVAGDFEFVLINVHLYFGDDTRADRERRSLEAFAVSRWADLRRDDEHAYVPHILALGDFNLPKVEPGDLIYTALRRRGLERPPHSTRISSSIAEDKDYDQIMFFPGALDDRFTGQIGVFDFDGAVFAELWQNRTPAQFRAYVRYYLSDHRPLWARFRIA